MKLEQISAQRCFNGWHRRYRHHSEVLGCDMVFAVYQPDLKNPQDSHSVLYWLSGLTCTDENFMQKAGAMRLASELGLMIVAPDTSPRGEGVPGDPQGSWDFGLGAGFYVNALESPWSTHYRMYDYVVSELPALIQQHFSVSGKQGISGHSMGGHGALICALRNPGMYQSVSAFAPIANPVDCAWGQKAFGYLLGEHKQRWAQWDASLLLAAAQAAALPEILVDQGDADPFLLTQLKPEALIQAAKQSGCALTLRMQPGYDHSYFFIASFIDDHLRHHAKALKSMD